MYNLAAERKSVPQVHMPVSLISTMGTTRHPRRLLRRWKSSKTVRWPPSIARAVLILFTDVNNAYHHDPGHKRPPGETARVSVRLCSVCTIQVRR